MGRDLLADLNEAQRRAVTHGEGALLVVAGAGSGKTRVITHRIAYLLSQGVPAWQITGVTFTNKAAEQMRRRVEALVGAGGVRLSTFHALGARLLRRFAGPAGLSEDFSIYDEDDVRRLVKELAEELGLAGARWAPAALRAGLSRLKNELIAADEYCGRNPFEHALAELYPRYQEELRRRRALDFDDLLVETVRLLGRDAGVRARCQERARWLLIDEYQDTNRAQYELLRLLSGTTGNVCAVGDPDQSIYAWRGADRGNLDRFRADFPGHTVVTLEQNYRSVNAILALANGLIAHNPGRTPKELWSALGPGTPSELHLCTDPVHEAHQVAALIRRELAAPDCRANDVAVCYRTNAQSRALEARLRDEGLPYVLVGTVAFYQRREIKDALAYLRALQNPDDDGATIRCLNVPPRGLGKTTLARFMARARREGRSLLATMAALAAPVPPSEGKKRRTARGTAETGGDAGDGGCAHPRGVPPLRGDAPPGGDAPGPALRRRVAAFTALFDRWRALGDFPVARLVQAVLDDSGLLARARAHPDPQEQERAENLEELVQAAFEFDHAALRDQAAQGSAESRVLSAEGQRSPIVSAPAPQSSALNTPHSALRTPHSALPWDAPRRPGLAGFLEQVALASDLDRWDDEQPRVTLMTLHAAKGLEFPVVIITGLEEGTLPHARARDEPGGLEEERRLFYVGITRAQRRLLLTAAATRGYGSEGWSRFLRELPTEHLRRIDLAGLPFGGDEDGEEGREASGFRLRGRAGAFLVRSPKPEARRGRIPLPPPADGFPAGFDPGDLCDVPIEEGQRVYHRRFGFGRVRRVSGSSFSPKLVVRFDEHGERTLVAAFARLIPVPERS